MRAIVLAAGLGTRMGSLTRDRPKPLLEVGGRPLIEWTLLRLAAAGVREVVVNHARFGSQFRARLGDGAAFGLQLRYSDEGDLPLGTAGGIRRALPLLGGETFFVVNADVWCDLDVRELPAPGAELACLLLVPNPDHHPDGDFSLAPDGRVGPPGECNYTYAGICSCTATLFDLPCTRPDDLGALLRAAAATGRLRGHLHRGTWLDVGTPARLLAAEALASGGPEASRT